ncbi:MAG TPA: MmgE/PrpD family protein [Pseudolysinimonas sp.]|nr:MmgE/PrpD family protein [Pseudolysinimonas sp.]
MPHPADLLDDVAAAILAAAGPADPSHAALLLADHLFCVRDSPAAARATQEPRTASDIAAENALRSCAGDRDDVDWARLIHSGSVVWPVVLALGGAAGVDGPTALAAASAGYDAGARVAEALGPEHRSRFHPTATAGLVGAAVAAAVVCGSSTEQTATAIGHALSVMGGSNGALRERSGTRGFHRAHAVRSGIAAAAAAQDGLPATRGDLIHGGGVLDPLDDERRRMLLRPAAGALAAASVRLHPTSGWNQCAFEAAALAGRELPGSIERIRVEASPAVVAASEAGEGADDERWVSLRWAAATGVLGPAAPAEEIVRLAALTDVVPHDAPGARVAIRAGGEVRTADVPTPQGHPDRPATPADLATKWAVTVAGMAELIGALEGIWAAGAGALTRVDDLVEGVSRPR